MKFFPKNAKTKKFKKPEKPAIKLETTDSAPQTECFDYRKEFDVLVKKLYKRLSPENSKKLWLLSSAIIFKNIGSSKDLKTQLHQAILQAHKQLKN